MRKLYSKADNLTYKWRWCANGSRLDRRRFWRFCNVSHIAKTL